MNNVLYCPVGAPQQQFGVYITGAGSELTKPGEPYPHAYHASEYYFTWENGRALTGEEYQILYIQSGRGAIEFQRGKNIPLVPGSIVLLHPGEWHRYRPDARTGWTEAYIGIGGEMPKRIFAKPFFPDKEAVLKVPPDGRFEHGLHTLIAEIHTSSTERPYTLALKALSLLVKLCEDAHGYDRPSSDNVAIRRAHLYIAHHLNEVIDFRALAKHVGLGFSMFRKRFNEYTRMPPLEYQLSLRLRRAANLLSSSNIPITDIANDLGFSSLAYFSRFFHKRIGLSPIEYRRKHATLQLRNTMKQQ